MDGELRNTIVGLPRTNVSLRKTKFDLPNTIEDVRKTIDDLPPGKLNWKRALDYLLGSFVCCCLALLAMLRIQGSPLVSNFDDVNFKC